MPEPDREPMRWDPAQYGRYADQRSRPFFDLVAQIGARDPAVVVDLGCGSGELTAALARRWPHASVRGIDASPEMIERAPSDAGVAFAVGDAAAFAATGVDVLVSNAMLQWIPDHEALLRRWADELPPGGWLAFQVPSNFGAPSHRLMRELAASGRWHARLEGVLRPGETVPEPGVYLDLLGDAGLVADVWRTEYEHLLQGPDPVLEWVRGTALRPALAALTPEEGTAFTAEYAARLREAYPAGRHGTVFGFSRTFAVARKPGP
jgi:trans-aconitate 2-methyltransferase